jgi:GT2 family glycosyltransferase
MMSKPYPRPKPAVTVIVPTFNRGRDLRSTLDQLRAQPYSDFILWVIDQSDPPFAASNRGYIEEIGDDRLHYMHLPQRGLPNARNEGLVRVEGDIVVFVDDDVVILSDDWLGAHVRAYDDPAIGGVTGRHVERLLKTNAKRTACHISWGGRTIFNLFGNERVEVRSCKGSNMSFRMSAVRGIGGFDRLTQQLEETDFSTRIRAAGWRIVFEPEAEVLHLSTPAGGVREPTPLDTECRRFRSTAYYIRKHRGWLGVSAFVFTFTLIALDRAWRFRDVRALTRLFGAMFEGFARAARGPDQDLAMPDLVEAGV